MATTTSELSSVPTAADATNTQRRALVALGLGTFVGTLVFIIPPLFFPQMAAELNVSVPLLGQTTSLMMALSVVLAIVVGPLADRAGYRPLIVGGLISASICFLAFVLAPIFPILLLASAAGALTDASVNGPSYALAGTAFSSAGARRAIGVASAAQAGSAIVGVPLLVAIGSAAGWRTAFVVAGILAVLVVVPAQRWLPHRQQRSAGPLSLAAIAAPYQPLLQNLKMRRLLGATVLGAFVWSGLLTYLGAFLVQNLALAPGPVGIVYIVVGFGYVAGSLAVGGPLSRVSGRRLVVAGFLGCALCFGLAFSALAPPVVAVALLTATAAFAGVESVAMAAVLNAETPVGAGATMSLNGSLFNLGAAGGSAVGGVLLATAGYGAMAVGLPLFGIAAALLAWRSQRA